MVHSGPNAHGREEGFWTRRTPNYVDICVGDRIRLRRRQLGLSQDALAKGLGISFQQVQKYERGANRISASKLFQICGALGIRIGDLFEGLGGQIAGEPGLVVRDREHTSEDAEIAALTQRISPAKRNLLLAIAKALAG